MSISPLICWTEPLPANPGLVVNKLRLVSHVNRWLTGIEIHPGARIGRRVFIGETAEVGDDVLMYHDVVLGGTKLQKGKRHPTVGNGVVLGADSLVLGAITVGHNAKVGAGSVVIHDVPVGVTVVGAPAHVVDQPKPANSQVDSEHGAALGPLLDRTARLEKQVRQLKQMLAALVSAQALRQETLIVLRSSNDLILGATKVLAGGSDGCLG